MTIQLINIFERYLFKRYSQKYGIFRELYFQDQLGLEIRGLSADTAMNLKREFLNRKILSYISENGDNFDFLALGTLSAFHELVVESPGLEKDEIGKLILRKIENYAGNSAREKNILEKLGLPAGNISAMGILNVTPDSFSDGGKYFRPEDAIAHAKEMLKAGAEIIDIGGVSTRPGAKSISTEEELNRVLPVIKGILDENPEAVISIDTTKARVAEEALVSGAKIVNDISGATFEPEILDVASEHSAAIVLMHIKGTPETMQENPSYEDAVNEIYEFLEERIDAAVKKGIRKIIIDPGIGFGKRLFDNYEIISRLREFKALGYPLLIGISRKSMLGNALNIDVDKRDVPTVIAETVAVLKGANIVRTHNVKYLNYLKQISNFVNNPEELKNA
jgi:dihydropteroate synthase